MDKQKGLFDHFRQITFDKKSNYWQSLSEEEQKQYSIYMINRLLSMNIDYIELVDDIQYYNLTPEMSERFYRDVLPKKKIWNKYLKPKQNNTSKDIAIVAEHYQISMREASSYIAHMSESDIKNIKSLYGHRFE
jgi:hypothetical protein